MRARLRYLALAPSTPARVAAWTVDLGTLVLATAALIAVIAGYSPVVALAHVIVALGDVLGTTA